MVRVAGLKRRIATGLAVPTNVGRAPLDVLARHLAEGPRAAGAARARVFQELVKPALDEAGIHIVSWGDLGEREPRTCATYFSAQIFPVLMPLAVDPAHPFPYISGLSLNLSVRVRNSRRPAGRSSRASRCRRCCRASCASTPTSDRGRCGTSRSRTSSPTTSATCSPAWRSLEHHEFRVTRNEDVEIEEDETENLIKALEKELLRRRFGPPIRLEITDDMDDVTLGLLVRELDVTEQEVFRLPAPLDLGGLFDLARLDRPELHYPTPRADHRACSCSRPSRTCSADVFAAIARQDVLLHHPYESFATSVQAFLEQAAADPNVLAIKQTLYRTSGDSPIVEALIDAAEAGKQVLALVEIKARFDEQANISWARKLEKAGVHVVYGLVGLKTHCKLALVDPPGEGRPAPLQPHRHGQLQPEDEPHLRGPRAAHRRRPGRQGPHPPLQRALRLRHREEVQAPPRRAAAPAQGPAQAHRRRDRATPRPAGPPASGSRSTRSSTRRSSTRSTARRTRACRSRCGCAASAACARASRASARTSGCARSSAATSSTRASSRSRTTATRRSTSASPT